MGNRLNLGCCDCESPEICINIFMDWADYGVPGLSSDFELFSGPGGISYAPLVGGNPGHALFEEGTSTFKLSRLDSVTNEAFAIQFDVRRYDFDQSVQLSVSDEEGNEIEWDYDAETLSVNGSSKGLGTRPNDTGESYFDESCLVDFSPSLIRAESGDRLINIDEIPAATNPFLIPRPLIPLRRGDVSQAVQEFDATYSKPLYLSVTVGSGPAVRLSQIEYYSTTQKWSEDLGEWITSCNQRTIAEAPSWDYVSAMGTLDASHSGWDVSTSLEFESRVMMPWTSQGAFRSCVSEATDLYQIDGVTPAFERGFQLASDHPASVSICADNGFPPLLEYGQGKNSGTRLYFGATSGTELPAPTSTTPYPGLEQWVQGRTVRVYGTQTGFAEYSELRRPIEQASDGFSMSSTIDDLHPAEPSATMTWNYPGGGVQ